MPITDDFVRKVMWDVLKRKHARETEGLDNVPTDKPVDAPAGAKPMRTIATELDCWRTLGRRLIDPDDLGWACSQEVREQVRRLLP